mmetsp:Transcript_156640/g.380436  ORF Transcript_156640/g.380436 Transcript_156640/m.380436 type:complete len:147 (+) Transcript_156640:549-989(+)
MLSDDWELDQREVAVAEDCSKFLGPWVVQTWDCRRALMSPGLLLWLPWELLVLWELFQPVPDGSKGHLRPVHCQYERRPCLYLLKTRQRPGPQQGQQGPRQDATDGANRHLEAAELVAAMAQQQLGQRPGQRGPRRYGTDGATHHL